jgi:hypothetical protein
MGPIFAGVKQVRYVQRLRPTDPPAKGMLFRRQDTSILRGPEINRIVRHVKTGANLVLEL